MKGRLDRSHIHRRLNEKPKLLDFLSVRKKNITAVTGENKLYAAVHELKINLAQAGKIAVSWLGLTVVCPCLGKAQWWMPQLISDEK